MKTFLNSLMLLVFLAPSVLLAQNIVTGTVIDQANAMPLPGVNILIKGTATGATTDFDGKYTINAKTGDVLVFSYVGYKTTEVTYNGQATINATLAEDAAQLDEVVLIGYGSVKKEDLTGSVDMLSSKDFNKGPIVSAQQLVSGRIPGVSVTSGSGSPGDGQNIIIRGLGSLTLTSSPLIVVDGIPLNNDGVGGSRNVLNMINPNDIENMTVLKDASATAIFGSRGANGVIIITTKKNKSSDFKFNVSSSTTVYEPIDQVDVLNSQQYRTLINSLGNPDAIALLGNSNTNWQDLIFKTAIGQEHSISAMGNAFDVLPMRVSIGFSDHDGNLIGDNFQRSTAALNLNPSFLDDHLKVELNARGSYTENTFADRGAIGSAVDFDPTQSPYNPNSQYGGYFYWANPTSPDGIQSNLVSTNPLALLNLIDDTSEVRRLIGSVKIDYKLHFFSDITSTVNVGIDKSNSHGRKLVSDVIPTTDPLWNGSKTRYTNEQTNKLLDAYFTYNKTIKEHHNVTLAVGYSYQSFEFDSYSYDSEREEDAIANPDSNIQYEFIDKSKNVLLSYFGRLNYDFDGKYLVTATLRADASSKLNPKDRWGYFPSAAVAWNMHKEGFMQDSFFEELKLRVGYGEVGNVNGLRDYLFLTNYVGSQSTANYQFGYDNANLPSFYQTYRPSAINENLRWEIGRSLNVGMDYAFLNRRVYGSVNAYIKETKDLISNVTVDSFTNFSNTIDANIGDMENKGIEFALNLVPVRNNDFEWTINYNIAFNKNEITNLPDDITTGGINGGTGNNIQLHTEGRSPYSFWVYKQVYDVDGRPIEGAYVDRNGDNIINDDDRYIYKDPYADVLMGLNTNLNYKNWDLSIATRASIGNYSYNNVASSKGYLNRATENGFLFNIHSDYYNTGFDVLTENNLKSDHYIEESSFFKVDNITLGYTLNNAIKNSTIRIYGSLQNVATITDYKGLDPEITGGIDNGFYPRPRSFVLGLNFDF